MLSYLALERVRDVVWKWQDEGWTEGGEYLPRTSRSSTVRSEGATCKEGMSVMDKREVS